MQAAQVKTYNVWTPHLFTLTARFGMIEALQGMSPDVLLSPMPAKGVMLHGMPIEPSVSSRDHHF